MAVFLAVLSVPFWTTPASAAPFEFQSGYYVGTGVAGLAISGVGFQPDYVMIKSTTTAGTAVFKTSAMPANTTAFTSGAANNTGTNITFTADGFTLGTLVNVNTANVVYHWSALTGSDCSATGNFCVGTYTGNAASPRNITVGFQPSAVIVKQSSTAVGHFRVASQPANETLYLNQTARQTTGVLIRSFAATSFQVGATDNANGQIYYYVAFADTAGAFDEGTYTGNGTDNRNITGVGFDPDLVLVKSATGSNNANRRPVMNYLDSYGDSSSSIGDTTAAVANNIQGMITGGFQVGASARVNNNTDIYYYFAIAGAADHTASGDFEMATGSYVGTGAVNSVSGLGFKPDLVIVKADTTQFAVFRTRTMAGDTTAYFSSATANFALGITSLNADGFSLGTATMVNSNGVTYRWQAFGGAFNPYDNTGSSDFAVGTYYGNTIDNRNITRLPWQPDMVTVKRAGTSLGAWRPSSQVGDSTSFFSATTPAADVIQSLNADGFQVGINASANTLASVYHWFAFRDSANFSVGSYTGTGTALNITSAGLRAESVWVKRNTNIAGVMSSVANPGGQSQYFSNVANVGNRITGFYKNGFSLGTATTEANTSAGTYYYAAWNDTDHSEFGVDIVDSTGQTVASPSYPLGSSAFNFDCTTATGSLGTSPQRIQITNITSNPNWSLSVAPTSGPAALWANIGDTEQYDFNDPTSGGCADGGDADSEAGRLGFDASVSTLGGETGCSGTGIGLPSLTTFSEGATDSVELAAGGATADTDCIWELTGVGAQQVLPAEQAIGQYDINLTLTLVAI